MKLSTFLVITAVVAFLFGLAFVLIAGPLMSLYGASLSPGGLLVARLFGAALLGFAVLTWCARNAEDSEGRKAIILALFISDAIGFIVALIGQLSGVVNALGWSTVIIYLLLALGFGRQSYLCWDRNQESGEAWRTNWVHWSLLVFVVCSHCAVGGGSDLTPTAVRGSGNDDCSSPRWQVCWHSQSNCSQDSVGFHWAEEQCEKGAMDRNPRAGMGVPRCARGVGQEELLEQSSFLAEASIRLLHLIRLVPAFELCHHASPIAFKILVLQDCCQLGGGPELPQVGGSPPIIRSSLLAVLPLLLSQPSLWQSMRTTQLSRPCSMTSSLRPQHLQELATMRSSLHSPAPAPTEQPKSSRSIGRSWPLQLMQQPFRCLACKLSWRHRQTMRLSRLSRSRTMTPMMS